MKYKKFNETRAETIILDTHVEMRWNAGNKKRYVDLGYKFTKMRDSFIINVCDLPDKSKAVVSSQCPICKQIKNRRYQDITKVGHTLCVGCAGMCETAGVRFGRLVAIDIDYEKTEYRSIWWLCDCDCGKRISIRRSNLIAEQSTTSCGCYAEEIRRSMCGEKHYNWNPSITAEQRLIKRRYIEYKRWVQDIYKQDKHICQVCGDDKGGNLNAHHLYSYSDYVAYQLKLWNGITVCEECHKCFHSFMGGASVKCSKLDFYTWLQFLEKTGK